MSVLVHASFFIFPASVFLKNTINVDIYRAPVSVELSIVQRVRPLSVASKKIEKKIHQEADRQKPHNDKTLLKQKKVSKGQNLTERVRPHNEPVNKAGAITQQISTLTVNKPPIYPTLARLKGWEGKVVILASIDSRGNVANAVVISSTGFYVLDKAALEAVKKWRFRNTKTNLQIEIPVKFVLKQ